MQTIIIKQDTEFLKDKIGCLVIEMINAQKEINANFLQDNKGNTINLKKRLVRDSIRALDETNKYAFVGKYLNYIQDYMLLLQDFAMTTDIEFDYSFLETRLRVKLKDSMVYKLLHYAFGKNEQGKTPLNKCLNDLMGARVFVDDLDIEGTVDALEDYLSEIGVKYSCKVSVRDSSKLCYRAVHIYIQDIGSNYCFPWEIQIWDRKDIGTNEQCHKMHKQEYTKWTGIYNQSDIFEKGG